MYAKLLVLTITLVTCSSDARETAVTSDDQINCGACKGLFDEIDYLVSKVPDYASIDTGSQREWGKDSKKKSFARSEVHLYEVLDVACHEMENYSGFEEQGRKVYKRYQNRPEQKTPLKLANFGWHVDTQARLRFACDTIMNVHEEELVEAYMESTEVPFKINLCTTYCERASMIFQLNAWYGKDINGNQLPDDETEYVDGVLKADALAKKNKKEYKLHKKKVSLDDKKKAREEREKAAQPKASLDDLSADDEALGQDGKKSAAADDAKEPGPAAEDSAGARPTSPDKTPMKKKTSKSKSEKKKQKKKKKKKNKKKKAAKDEL